MLMKKMILFLLATAAVSCGLVEIGGGLYRGNGEVWIRPGVNADSMAVGNSVVYVTAVDYVDWYDWVADRENGSVKCSLVVFADGTPMMKVPVGDRYEVSSDPDTHWMENGHLYTNYTSDRETVIRKDGKEFIRYPGREMICDLTEHGGEVYTLCHDVDGEGFAYRRNGEVIFSSDAGFSFGRLHYHNDTISFAFREPVSSDGRIFERYYCFRDGEVFQTAVREDVRKVWDIVLHDGKIHYAASLVGIPFPVLLSEDGMRALTMPQSSEILTCMLVSNGEALYVEGLVELNDGDLLSCLWSSDGRVHEFPYGMSVSSSCMNGDGICCILNPPPSSYSGGEVYRCGESFLMPYGYFSIGPRTSSFARGILHAGLSSFNGEPPVLWRDGEITPLKVNGFITSVSTDME